MSNINFHNNIFIRKKQRPTNKCFSSNFRYTVIKEDISLRFPKFSISLSNFSISLSFSSLILSKGTASTSKICVDFFSSAAFDIKFSKSFSSCEHSFFRSSFIDLIFSISNSTSFLAFTCSGLSVSFFCSAWSLFCCAFVPPDLFFVCFVGNYDGNCRLPSQIPRAASDIPVGFV